MPTPIRFVLSIVACVACVACAPSPAPPPAAPRPPASASPAPRTGEVHDFDFFDGAWTVHNRRLKPGAADNQWEEFASVSCAASLLGGLVNIDELRFPTGGGGVSLRMFHTERRQWSEHWVSARDGVLQPPVVGAFEGDQGDLLGEDEDNGQPVKVRFRWIKRGPDHVRWEQASSHDGHTWDTNWISEFTRAPSSTCDQPFRVTPGEPARPAPAASALPVRTGDVHDFDFLTGAWTVQNRRLKARGVGSTDWEEFPATSCATIQLGGMVNIDEIRFPTKGWAGITFRTFRPETRQWSLYWINSRLGALFPPVHGGFTGDRGEFYGDDEDDGRPVKVRFQWTKLGPDRAHWEQAFSSDGGRTWEVNWTNDFTRAAPATCAARS